MASLDLSSMNPSDGAVALRSLPRRYREAAATASTADLDGDQNGDESEERADRIDEMASRVGPDGLSAADLVRAAIERAALVERLLRSALVTDNAVAPATLFAGAAAEHVEGASPFGAAVDELAARCTALAEVVEQADPGRWTTSITREDGGSTTPLEALQVGVAALVSWERQIAPTLRAVRGRPS